MPVVPESYENYTDFDLSLLPNSDKDHLATIYDNVVPSSNNFAIESSPFLTPEYIQSIATDFLDVISIKTEKNWELNVASPQNTYQTQSNNFPFLLEQTRIDQENLLTILPPSPTPSLDVNSSSHFNPSPITIKQEYSLLPLSPPDSSGAPSPFSCGEPIKMENLDGRRSDSIDSCFEFESCKKEENHEQFVKQDHQLLREYLQDTTFQKKHNIKPLALESLLGGWTARNDIEPVISMALEQARQDVEATCTALNIPTG